MDKPKIPKLVEQLPDGDTYKMLYMTVYTAIFEDPGRYLILASGRYWGLLRDIATDLSDRNDWRIVNTGQFIQHKNGSIIHLWPIHESSIDRARSQVFTNIILTDYENQNYRNMDLEMLQHRVNPEKVRLD